MWKANGKVAEVEIEPGKKEGLYFNLNTMAEFEDRSGKRFLEATVGMMAKIAESSVEAVKAWRALHPDEEIPKPDADGQMPEPFRTMGATAAFRHVSMADMRNLLHAAIQRYRPDGEVSYPYSAGQIGGIVDLEKWGELLPHLMKGIKNNQPTKDDVPPAVLEANEKRPTNGVPSPEISGGPPCMPSDADILDSLTPISEG